MVSSACLTQPDSDEAVHDKEWPHGGEPTADV
jgi:hypothetical protein